MNKKATLADAIYGPMFILIIGMVMVIAYFIWSNISSLIGGLPAPNGSNVTYFNQTMSGAITNINTAFSTFDYMIPFIVGGLLMVSLILAFKRGASVAYIGLSLVFWVLAMIMASVFSNIFASFAAQFTTTLVDFPILSWIMDNINYVVLAWLFLISTVMFIRNKREDQYISSATEAVFQ